MMAISKQIEDLKVKALTFTKDYMVDKPGLIEY